MQHAICRAANSRRLRPEQRGKALELGAFGGHLEVETSHECWIGDLALKY